MNHSLFTWQTFIRLNREYYTFSFVVVFCVCVLVLCVINDRSLRMFSFILRAHSIVFDHLASPMYSRQKLRKKFMFLFASVIKLLSLQVFKLVMHYSRKIFKPIRNHLYCWKKLVGWSNWFQPIREHFPSVAIGWLKILSTLRLTNYFN